MRRRTVRKPTPSYAAGCVILKGWLARRCPAVCCALGAALEVRGIAVRLPPLPITARWPKMPGWPVPIAGFIRELMDFELVYQALYASVHALPLGFALGVFCRQPGLLVQQIMAD
ncbi:MAG: hypothetical protein U0074_08895 [Kouleothrix sp.]